MCTGIVHVYRCQHCSAAVYKLREAVKGYTCHQARRNKARGLCRTGISYVTYDRYAEDVCLYCELYLGAEITGLRAETCDEGGEPWPEDREDDIDVSEGGASLKQEDYGPEDEVEETEDEQDDGEEEDEDEEEDEEEEEEEDDDDDDEEEGGAKATPSSTCF
ncbi:hypothetical protein F5B17DRAFT_388776 [Nemania serpens]|nr:hypothetical protein F5B17DRAFT_388776 [Nemania serpens]